MKKAKAILAALVMGAGYSPASIIDYTFSGVLNHVQATGIDLKNGMKFAGEVHFDTDYINQTHLVLDGGRYWVAIDNGMRLSENSGARILRDPYSLTLDGSGILYGIPGSTYYINSFFRMSFGDPSGKLWEGLTNPEAFARIGESRHWSISASTNDGGYGDPFNVELRGKVTHIDGTPVPETGGALCLAIGVLAVMVFKHPQFRGRRSCLDGR